MKALSVHQPWGALIVDGRKHIETRSWSTNYRGKLAIHATKKLLTDRRIYINIHNALHKGKQFDGSWLYYMGFRWEGDGRGCIIGTVDLVDCVPLDEIRKGKTPYTALATEREIALGDWSAGRYGWILDNPNPFDTPIIASGNVGLWNWGGSRS